jgi:hypothetical protein
VGEIIDCPVASATEQTQQAVTSFERAHT